MNKHLIISLVCTAVLVAGTACSSRNTPEQTSAKKRSITITEQGEPASSPNASAPDILRIANATITEETNTLSASWTAGDLLTYCNLSRYNPNTYEFYTGSLTAASTATTAQLTGEVNCINGDCLAVVYPATTFTSNDTYTISLTGQDGTLASLATHYHYLYSCAYVTSVTGNTATATMPKMKSLLTVCKFSFTDKETSTIIPIKTLAISYGGSGSDSNTYPQSASVAISENTAQTDIHVVGVTGSSPLTITCPSAQNEVYVALLPTPSGERTYNFTVTTPSDETYSGTARATLHEGEYVVATELKLIKNQ